MQYTSALVRKGAVPEHQRYINETENTYIETRCVVYAVSLCSAIVAIPGHVIKTIRNDYLEVYTYQQSSRIVIPAEAKAYRC